jgi:hypothetical protein
MLIYRTILAVTAAALGAMAVLALPGFSPEVEASAPPVAETLISVAPAANAATATTQKTDRLEMRPIGPECSQKGWPYYETTCLRDRSRTDGQPRTVRVIKLETVAGK